MQTFFSIPNYKNTTWVFPENASVEDAENVRFDENGDVSETYRPIETPFAAEQIFETVKDEEKNGSGNFIVDLAQEYLWFYYEDSEEAKTIKQKVNIALIGFFLFVALLIISNQSK